MKLYRSEQTRNFDSNLIDQIGVPSVVLMEHAARGVFEEILNRFPNIHLNDLIVLYGTGNNGGDALCLARMLVSVGCKVSIVEAVAKPKTPDSKLQMELLLKSVANKKDLKQMAVSEVSKSINDNTIIIDGVFGTGFKATTGKALDKKLIKLFEDVSKASYVFSIDVPSGVDADTGEAIEGAMVADCTVSFVYPKVGLFISPASVHAGDIIVKSLFFPVEQMDTKYELITEHFARELIAPITRKPNSHKGSFGHVAVISPDDGMEGSVAMTAMAALRAGAGLVTVLAVNESKEALRQRMPMLISEVMVSEIDPKDNFKKFSSVVIGPGFGKKRKAALKEMLQNAKVPLVIDADALNIIAEDKKLFDILKNKDAVLTPHPGEMSRLYPDIAEIQEHRLNALESYVKGHKFSVLLKGYRSMLGRGNGEVFVNYTGNPALSKGGNGDVLSGIIAAFIAQGLDTGKAGALAMYVHGLCADRLVMEENNSDFGILPTDIIKELGNVIRCLTE